MRRLHGSSTGSISPSGTRKAGISPIPGIPTSLQPPTLLGQQKNPGTVERCGLGVLRDAAGPQLHPWRAMGWGCAVGGSPMEWGSSQEAWGSPSGLCCPCPLASFLQLLPKQTHPISTWEFALSKPPFWPTRHQSINPASLPTPLRAGEDPSFQVHSHWIPDS